MSIFKNIGYNPFKQWLRKKPEPYEVLIECEIKDKDGKTVSIHTQKAHSYLFAYLVHIYFLFSCDWGGASHITNPCNFVDTGGVTRNMYSAPYNSPVYTFPMYAPSADSTYGIVVGSVNTANVLATNTMGTQITHGTGTGQLQYGSTTIDYPYNPSGMIWQSRLIRVFSNGTAGLITVREIGMIGKLATSAWYGLFCRDVISVPQDVNPAQTLTVRYIHKITVS